MVLPCNRHCALKSASFLIADLQPLAGSAGRLHGGSRHAAMLAPTFLLEREKL
jgi:hypothetical protein